MEFNKQKFTQEILLKMHKVIFDLKKKHGLDYFSKQIGTSKATLSRVLNFKDFDVKTLLLILTWLEKDFNEFIIK